MAENSTTVRLKVSPEVARVVARDAPRELKLAALEGRLPLPEKDRLVALFFLAHSADPGIRGQALATLKSLPADQVAAGIADPGLDSRLIDFLSRLKLNDVDAMRALLEHPAMSADTLKRVAAEAGRAVLSLLARNRAGIQGSPELMTALRRNPGIDPALKERLGGAAEDSPSLESQARPSEKEVELPVNADAGAVEEADDGNKTKYQLALEMGVSEKIKMAMTGDKEWRNLLIKEANKLVSTAVLKNPRISEGEVLTVASNRSASEELIRLITMNTDWLKNQAIKKALVQHPRTPLPKALRYMDVLTEKELKLLAKSRNVSQVIVNNARRLLLAKEKK